MRKIVLATAACGLVLALGASAALADHHDGRPERRHQAQHRRHESRHRRHDARHRRRIRHERFGGDSAPESTAGTVSSFTNGVLTITLADGSMVSGKVAGSAEVECEAAEDGSMQADERGSGNDGGGDNSGSDDNGDNGDDQAPTCGTADLTPGTPVHEAELKVSSAGAIWDRVELIVPGAAVDS